VKQLKKEEFFIKQGQVCNTMAFVYEGVLRNYLLDYEGREANFRFLTKYELVAGSFGKNVKTNINIQAIDNSTLVIAKWTDIDIYAKNNKWLVGYFNSFLADAHFKITKRMSSYIRLNAKERYLLFLREYPNLINQIPQYYIANHIGITPIQLSRIRKDLATGK
jgi:CRP-like cAMP-binding protein